MVAPVTRISAPPRAWFTSGSLASCLGARVSPPAVALASVAVRDIFLTYGEHDLRRSLCPRTTCPPPTNLASMIYSR